ncbi:hypothetical protein TNCV_2624281 [Trichonephila clavipes]|nr:hypothetical protein TNCV_2624281 [Trichonephila clavipes]
MCCRLTPHHLTDDQKQANSDVSQYFVEAVDATPNLLNCIVTEDESWCFSQIIIHKEFISMRTTMNAARYIDFLTRFMKRLSRVRPQYAQQGPCFFFVHDNARPNTVNIFKQFLTTKKRGGAN